MEFVTEPPKNLALRAGSQAVSWRKIAITLVDLLVSEAGDSQWISPRAQPLRAYDDVVNVVGNPSPTISGFPKPSPTRWSKRVSAATSFYAAFRPLFRQVGR
jgi:hypothetical protein